MKNLINFFFSFDKLFKEKLVIPFFWLALVTWGLDFFSTALDSIALYPLAVLVKFVQFLVSILLALVVIRLVSELAIALFRINDNLSPDGGKSETADIDPMEEARKAASLAAARTREATKTVKANVEAKVAAKGHDSGKEVEVKKPIEKTSAPKKPTAKKSAAPKKKPAAKKPAAKKPAAKKSAAKKPAVKKKATPKKTATKKSPAKKTTAKKVTPKKKL